MFVAVNTLSTLTTVRVRKIVQLAVLVRLTTVVPLLNPQVQLVTVKFSFEFSRFCIRLGLVIPDVVAVPSKPVKKDWILGKGENSHVCLGNLDFARKITLDSSECLQPVEVTTDY